MRCAGARVVVALVALTLIVGCGDDDDDRNEAATTTSDAIGGVAEPGGPVAWPAPPADAVARLAADAGVPLATREQLAHHAHAHLDVFIDGAHRTVPAGLGIVITDPDVKTFDDPAGTSYGGIEGCDQPCISPLHTHDVSGVIHTESPTRQDNTLGQLFRLWDVRLDERCIGDYCEPAMPIKLYVDGSEEPLANAARIPLTDGTEIAVVIGDPPRRIPDRADFSGA